MELGFRAWVKGVVEVFELLVAFFCPWRARVLEACGSRSRHLSPKWPSSRLPFCLGSHFKAVYSQWWVFHKDLASLMHRVLVSEGRVNHLLIARPS